MIKAEIILDEPQNAAEVHNELAATNRGRARNVTAVGSVKVFYPRVSGNHQQRHAKAQFVLVARRWGWDMVIEPSPIVPGWLAHLYVLCKGGDSCGLRW